MYVIKITAQFSFNIFWHFSIISTLVCWALSGSYWLLQEAMQAMLHGLIYSPDVSPTGHVLDVLDRHVLIVFFLSIHSNFEMCFIRHQAYGGLFFKDDLEWPFHFAQWEHISQMSHLFGCCIILAKEKCSQICAWNLREMSLMCAKIKYWSFFFFPLILCSVLPCK